jgi:hypothetical protein
MKCVLLIAATALAFGQSANQKGPSLPKPDNWQRIKDCSAQAEKVFREDYKDEPGIRGILEGGPIRRCENHYSPQYQRCYLAIEPFWGPVKTKRGQAPSRWERKLLDPFERSTVAVIMCDGGCDGVGDSSESVRSLHLRHRT